MAQCQAYEAPKGFRHKIKQVQHSGILETWGCANDQEVNSGAPQTADGSLPADLLRQPSIGESDNQCQFQSNNSLMPRPESITLQ